MVAGMALRWVLHLAELMGDGMVVKTVVERVY